MTKLLKFFFAIFLVTASILFGQANIQDTSLTLINISHPDSLIDSTKTKSLNVNKLFYLFKEKNDDYFSTFSKSKKQIDFENYRYSTDILSTLPLVFQNDFGPIGFPNETILFGQRNKNFLVTENNFLISNRWNGYSDLNLFQTENISSVEILPLSRGFLSSSNNNAAVINLDTKDSVNLKPLSRMRYYQAPEDEAFIDAMFSANILNDLSVFFRLSNATFANSAGTGIFQNSEYGVWKLNVKSTYRFSDSLFASVSYYHLKSNTELNGGVDLSSLSSSNVSLIDGLYDTFAPITFEDRHKETKINRVSAAFFGKLYNSSFTRLSLAYNYNKDLFQQYLTDTLSNTRISNDNIFSDLTATLTHEQTIKKLFLKLSLGIDIIDYNLDQINIYESKNSNYFSLFSEYNFLDSLIIPAAFVKLGSYEDQPTSGYGLDLKIIFNSSIKLMSGFSYFNRPYLLSEISSLPKNSLNKNFISNFFVTAELSINSLLTSISYYKINSDNSPVPIFNNNDLKLNSTQIIFPFTTETQNEGLNLFTNIKIWQLEIILNGNYILSNAENFIPKNAKYNFNSGIFYRNKLFNDNLDLKTGFNFYYADNIGYQIYDFQNMNSASYYLVNNIATPFSSYSIDNKNYRLDFTLAGRIQNRATFYFAYENITGHNYYSIPYYPISSGGIKFGIAWDFIN